VHKETSVMKHVHSSRSYSGGLTKFQGLLVHSSPPYFPYCDLKMFTFEAKPLLNPRHGGSFRRSIRCSGGRRILGGFIVIVVGLVLGRGRRLGLVLVFDLFLTMPVTIWQARALRPMRVFGR
jgi:hypothetical protein